MSYVEDWQEIVDVADRLTEYTEIEGSEVGELCELLIKLSEYQIYMSIEFQSALLEELKLKYANFNENSTIVKREVTTTSTITELEWKVDQ